MKNSIIAILTVCTFSIYAQVPTVQDCLGAVAVCQEIFVEDLSFSGDGNYNNEINTSISCTAGELNSIWYTFTVNNSGDFGFVITPNNLDDDYDWALFDITNASCEDIFNDPTLQVSCNASGGNGCHGATGATGATVWDEQGAGCFFDPPSQAFGFSTFNDLIPVVEGNTYVLMVSNWTGSPFGYTIDFGVSTSAGIFDSAPPEVVDIQLPSECEDDLIEFNLNEFIQCSTIDPSNFSITGPGGPYTLELSSAGCDAGGEFDKEFTLSISPPLVNQGDYTLEFVVDGLTDLLDLCDNPIQSISFDFSIAPASGFAVDLGDPVQDICAGQTLLLDATAPGAVSYIWQDGSTAPTFTVTAPGTYFVEASDGCAIGTDTVVVVLNSEIPVVDLGNSTVLCEGEQLTLDATNDQATYLWSNGSTQPTIDISFGGTYSVTVTNACGQASDEIEIEFVPQVMLDLGPDIAQCIGDTILLDATVTGGNYLWQDGQTAPVIEVTEPGTYTVEVSTNCQTLTDDIVVNFISEEPLDLGADTVLCANDTLNIDLTIPGATYTWENGSVFPVRTITEDGVYAVTISTECKIFEDDIAVSFLRPISFDIGQNRYLCENQIFLDASTQGFANYRWQDGSELPFFVIREPGKYSVTVYNECESIEQSIEVYECENCQVYFPNVFSPDLNGINDRFRPLSDCPLENYALQIYDRWGALIFRTNDPFEGWDGRAGGQRAESGTYVWWVQFTVIENERPRTEEASGGITLVR